MSIFYYIWKVWLQTNHSEILQKDRVIPKIDNCKTVKTNQDIAERLLMEGIDVNYNTLIYVIDQYERMIRDFICEGYPIHTGNIIFKPYIAGEWNNQNISFNPEIHKRVVECTLSSKLYHELEKVQIQVLGIKDAAAYITEINGCKPESGGIVITRNEEMTIKGKNIKAVAKDGNTKDCIFLKSNQNMWFDIGEELIINESEEIKLNMPITIKKGNYNLVIHSYWPVNETGNAKCMNCIEYNQILTIK